MTARPRPVVWFERIAYFSLALSAVTTFIVLEDMRATVPDGPSATRGAVSVIFMITLAVYIPLIWLAARRGSNLARWILVVILGISLLGLLNVRAILDYGGPSAWIALVQFVLSAIMIGLLFHPESRKWFAGYRAVDPGIFG